jgi:diguanylate cyclase (GGDEF)-like protein/PAS domain S-box-containing protein
MGSEPEDRSESGNGHDRELAAELAQRLRDLARSDNIRRAVMQCATVLLRSLVLERSIGQVLELIGQATGLSRIMVTEHRRMPDGSRIALLRYAWNGPGLPRAETARDFTLHLESIRTGGAGGGQEPAAAPEILLARTAPEPAQENLESLGIRSALVMPLEVEGSHWGELIFADCAEERDWSPIEIDTIRTMAELMSAAIARAHDLEELSDASRIIENSPAILYRLDARKPHPLIYISRNVSRYGYEAGALMAAPTRYLEMIHPNDLFEVMGDLGQIVAGRMSEVSRERRIRTADGRYVWFEDRTRGLYDAEGRLTAIEGLLIDINDRKLAEAQIARYSFSDPLTGLNNREAFLQAVAKAFAGAQRGGPGFAIHYLDLDQFKDVNDVFGHSKGDELLKLVADRLRGAHRANDVIARLGGDEFAILQTDVSDPADAGALAARILRDIGQPYDLVGEIHITASIGIAVFTPEAAGPEELLKHADMALFRAKELGRNQYHFHSEELGTEVIERVTLAGDLRRALDRGELLLKYQPQVDTQTGKIVGMEALLRWRHPRHGMLCPTRFIPVAEMSGIILRLGRWVLRNVCRQIAAWRAEQLDPPLVAINVSAAQLKSFPEFDRELQQCLRNWQLEPSALEIELTESVLMETTKQHGEVIDRLRELGVSIAIDDFGTGYSSLGYLRAYRVNHIKIAQEFIQNLRPDSGDIAIVRAAISLARELGIAVIAEGVETQYQLDILTEAGCRYVQGYYFSRPMSAKQTGELLRLGRIAPASPAQREGALH